MHQLAPEAELDIDEIWCFTLINSSSLEIADRLIESITYRFWLLARYPEIGRKRDQDLRPGVRSFVVGEYVIFYRIEEGGRFHTSCTSRQPRH